MKKIITIFILQVLLLDFTSSNAQPPVPPAPPATASSSQDMAEQMQKLQQQMQQLQQQLQQLQNENRTLLDSSKKKVIIINGERMDDLDEKDMDSVMESIEKTRKGVEMKIYRNNDSMVVNLGKMKLKMSDNNPDPSLKVEKNEEIIITHKDSTNEHPSKFVVEFGGFRLGVNNYLYKGQFKNAPGYDPLELVPGKSINVGLGLFDAKLNIVKSYLTLHTMLGFDISNYRFNSTNMLIPKTDTVGFQPPAGDQGVTKNKLVATYLVLPVRLQMETNKNSAKSFRLGAGGRLGYLIGSHTKFIVNNQKIKNRDDFNLDVFKYGLEFTIGYSWLNFYFDYDLTPFFSNGVNPQLTPVSMGIVLGNF